MFAANLFDGRIYRLAIPEGAVVGSFAHGAASLAWGGEARPFGLAVYGDKLYHGVVEPISASRGVTIPVGHIYESSTDGSDLREVAAFPLDQEGAGAPAERWLADDQPVISDMDFRADGNMVVAIRNLAIDATLDELPLGLGDLLPAEKEDSNWHVVLTPERFDDTIAGVDEVLTGGVALVPGLDLVVAAGHTDVYGGNAASALWFDAGTGTPERMEPIGAPDADAAEWLQPGAGDIEVLCRPDTPLDADRVASATADAARIATSTAAAVATSVAAEATARPGTTTAIAPTLTAYAPTHAAPGTSAARQTVAPERATAAAAAYRWLVDDCNSDDPCFAVAHELTVNGSTPQVPHDSVTAFNRAGPPMVLAEGRDMGSVYGLAFDVGRGQLYAGAFDPRCTGPAGPGAIYRIDLSSGCVAAWAVLPTVRGSARFAQVGEAGFGDIDIDEAATQLYAVDLLDRHIYRLSLPDGELQRVFAHGATGETRGADGLPFGLGYRDGWLYHGVVPDLDRPRVQREAVIYRSRPDGTEMSDVARFRLDYRAHGQSTSHASAILVDIDFRPSGEAVVGLRDGLESLSGDLLPTLAGRSGWTVIVSPERYDDSTFVDESVTGGVAAVPWADRLVAVASSVRSTFDTGALWFDNVTGAILDRRQLAPRRREVKCDPSGKCSVIDSYEDLGDLEALCGGMPPSATPPPSPTSAPPPTDTPSPTPSLTASPTATEVPIPTTTATPRPEPIYLPLSLREQCVPGQQRVDVALVIDASSSMEDPTPAGRRKLDVALEAVTEFLGNLALPSDQAAIVIFNSDAWLRQELTGDRGLLASALQGIQTAKQTRLDRGVAVAHQELTSSRRRPGNQAVMIVLTDGLANPVPASVAVDEAAAAKADQITIFTIGLGSELDEWALEAMASRPDYYYWAPDAGDLAAIYRQIAHTIPFPAESFWGRR